MIVSMMMFILMMMTKMTKMMHIHWCQHQPLQQNTSPRVFRRVYIDECEHEEKFWKRTPCGHHFCQRCDGYVDPRTRIALKGPGPIIACNRMRKPWEEYEYLFREWMAGSGVLTEAMRKALGASAVRKGKKWSEGAKKVGRPVDILYDPRLMDLRIKANAARAKQMMKKRSVFCEHFAPSCTTSCLINTHKRRTRKKPYGSSDKEIPYDKKVDEETWMMILVCKLVRIKHEVGDAFTAEHIYPSPMLEMKYCCSM